MPRKPPPDCGRRNLNIAGTGMSSRHFRDRRRSRHGFRNASWVSHYTPSRVAMRSNIVSGAGVGGLLSGAVFPGTGHSDSGRADAADQSRRSAPPLPQSENRHDAGTHQQAMNRPAQNVTTHHSQQPQGSQYQCYRQKHIVSFGLRFFRVMPLPTFCTLRRRGAMGYNPTLDPNPCAPSADQCPDWETQAGPTQSVAWPAQSGRWTQQPWQMLADTGPPIL